MSLFIHPKFSPSLRSHSSHILHTVLQHVVTVHTSYIGTSNMESHFTHLAYGSWLRSHSSHICQTVLQYAVTLHTSHIRSSNTGTFIIHPACSRQIRCNSSHTCVQSTNSVLLITQSKYFLHPVLQYDVTHHTFYTQSSKTESLIILFTYSPPIQSPS